MLNIATTHVGVEAISYHSREADLFIIRNLYRNPIQYRNIGIVSECIGIISDSDMIPIYIRIHASNKWEPVVIERIASAITTQGFLCVNMHVLAGLQLFFLVDVTCSHIGIISESISESGKRFRYDSDTHLIPI